MPTRILAVRALPSGECTMEQHDTGRCPPAGPFRGRYVQSANLMSLLASRSAVLISRQDAASATETILRLNDATHNFNWAAQWAEDVWTGACSPENDSCGDGMSLEHIQRVLGYFDRADRRIRSYLSVVDDLLARGSAPGVAANAFRAKSIEDDIVNLPEVPQPPPRPASSSSSSSSSASTSTQTETRVKFWIAAGLIGFGTFAIYKLHQRNEQRRMRFSRG